MNYLLFALLAISVIISTVIVGIGRVSRLCQEVVREEFGVRPTVKVVMHLVPSEGYEEGMANVAGIVAALLKRVDDDAESALWLQLAKLRCGRAETTRRSCCGGPVSWRCSATVIENGWHRASTRRASATSHTP